MDPEIAANVVHGGKVSRSDKNRKEQESLVQKMVDDSSPYGAAGMHHIHDVIYPQETREYITKALEIAEDSNTQEKNVHKLANWPTKF